MRITVITSYSIHYTKLYDGLYVPGGKQGSTPLVSSVLMNGIPAQIAGVSRRVMVTPPNPEGRVSPALLAAAREIGIDEVYKVGSVITSYSIHYTKLYECSRSERVSLTT